jgi:methyl coenzyme M reductase subunit C-like uncharacterized protein (methanogenesis marker protein 7)
MKIVNFWQHAILDEILQVHKRNLIYVHDICVHIFGNCDRCNMECKPILL